jgi:hypothetical protein
MFGPAMLLCIIRIAAIPFLAVLKSDQFPYLSIIETAQGNQRRRERDLKD